MPSRRLALFVTLAALAASPVPLRADDLHDEAVYDREARQVVPRDAFPVLDDPPVVPAVEASGLGDHEPVIGIVIDGHARAYPVRVMGVHELVNDTLGGAAIAASW
jgi:hypothetical protein